LAVGVLGAAKAGDTFQNGKNTPTPQVFA